MRTWRTYCILDDSYHARSGDGLLAGLRHASQFLTPA